MKLPRRIGPGAALVIAGVLALVGALLWARGRDPYVREWFAVKVPGGPAVQCLAVFPKPEKPRPVVVYLHGSGGSLVNDGRDLRRLAELGLAAVSVEYNQTNESAGDAQLSAVLASLGGRRWADTNAVAWLGYSLGANRWLDFAVRQEAVRPVALVRLAGGPPQTNGVLAATLSDLPVLLVHGTEDEVFPVAHLAQTTAWLEAQGAKVEAWRIAGADHGFRNAWGGVLRSVGEWCRERFGLPKARTDERSVNEWRAGATALGWWLLPAGLWLAGVWVWNRGHRAAACPPPCSGTPVSAAPPGWSWVLRGLTTPLALAALGVVGLHLMLPRLAATDRTRTLATRFLVSTGARSDFDWLAHQSAGAVWRIGLLRDHAELAHYNRGLVNWTVDDAWHREFVLWPVLDAEAAAEPRNWRRPLWESLYPRVRRESSLTEAAAMVIRHLRERVSVASGAGAGSAAADWQRQATDAAGWERLCVAALRAVGIPARVARDGQAEIRVPNRWVRVAELASEGGVWQARP